MCKTSIEVIRYRCKKVYICHQGWYSQKFDSSRQHNMYSLSWLLFIAFSLKLASTPHPQASIRQHIFPAFPFRCWGLFVLFEGNSWRCFNSMSRWICEKPSSKQLKLRINCEHTPNSIYRFFLAFYWRTFNCEHGNVFPSSRSSFSFLIRFSFVSSKLSWCRTNPSMEFLSKETRLSLLYSSVCRSFCIFRMWTHTTKKRFLLLNVCLGRVVCGRMEKGHKFIRKCGTGKVVEDFSNQKEIDWLWKSFSLINSLDGGKFRHLPEKGRVCLQNLLGFLRLPASSQLWKSLRTFCEGSFSHKL
jgi:hypothetical protein